MAPTGKARASVYRPPAPSVETDDAQQLQAAMVRLELATRLWQEFLRTYRVLIDKMAEQMTRDHKLPLEWFDVLFHLADQPDGRLRQRALRDRLLLSESGISRRLSRIEQAGLITRSTAGEDKRGIVLTLTPRGRTALIEAVDSHIVLSSVLFTQRLTRSDLDALTRILAKLTAESEDVVSPMTAG
jgi:DNA-binding MarR family transcriptional regulator